MGRRAQKVGKGFEAMFTHSCNQYGVAVVEIPDGCRVFGPGKMFRTKTPFDKIIEFKGRVAVIDCKTFEHNTLTFSDVKPHQLEALFKLSRNGAVIGAYVCYFRKVNQLVMFTADQMETLTPGSGLNHGEGAFLGTLETFDPRLIFQREV